MADNARFIMKISDKERKEKENRIVNYEQDDKDNKRQQAREGGGTERGTRKKERRKEKRQDNFKEHCS